MITGDLNHVKVVRVGHGNKLNLARTGWPVNLGNSTCFNATTELGQNRCSPLI